MAEPCPFASLREHVADECPLCNPTGWMAKPDQEDRRG